ncbi:hypothetical protein EON65_27545, partial [archaeon]
MPLKYGTILVVLLFSWLYPQMVRTQGTVGFMDQFTSSDRSNYAVTFNLVNTNSYPIAVTEVSTQMNAASGFTNMEVWFRATPVSGQTILDGYDGWVIVWLSNVAVTSNVATLTINVGDLVIPANSSYGMAVKCDLYLNTPILTTTYTSSVGGVTAIIGDTNSYAADPCCNLEFNPRGFWGSLQFVDFSVSPTTEPTVEPSSAPSTLMPTELPTMMPTPAPSIRPTTCQPTGQPSGEPTRQPTRHPSCQPTNQPSGQPSGHPTAQPIGRPSSQPSYQPSRQPSTQPTRQPSVQPFAEPSTQPTMQPSSQPSLQPSARPIDQPTAHPSSQPTCHPSAQPSTQPSSMPSAQPSRLPTNRPSCLPTVQPSKQPSSQLSGVPSTQPSSLPTSMPSYLPTVRPSTQPSAQPTCIPTNDPSTQPTSRPTSQPTIQPTCSPFSQPTAKPSCKPSAQPSFSPTAQPTTQPSASPSLEPSAYPSSWPSSQPSNHPTVIPSRIPTCQPCSSPTSRPSDQLTSQPSSRPSSVPSTQPSAQPSRQPSILPTAVPSSLPTGQPSRRPSRQPTGQPTNRPSCQPSSQPSIQPSSQPNVYPSCQPSLQPFSQPSTSPTNQPSRQPTSHPTRQPTSEPSCYLSSQPSNQPTTQPTLSPTAAPVVTTVMPTTSAALSNNALSNFSNFMASWNNGSSGNSVVIFDTYRVVSEVLRNVAANEPIQVTLPLTSEEQQLVDSGLLKLPSISLMPNSTDGNLSVAIGLFDKSLWNSTGSPQQSIKSDIVVVQVIGGLKFVDITFPVDSEPPPPPPVNYSIACRAGERKWKNYTCIDSGFTDYFQCIGIPGIYGGTCPVLSESCSALDLSSRSTASVASGQVCTTLNATLTFRTCRCTLGSAAQLGTSEIAAGIVVRFVGSDFSNTFKAAGALNSQGAASKASTMIILFSTLWGSALVLMLVFGIRRLWDHEAGDNSDRVGSKKSWLTKRLALRQKSLWIKKQTAISKSRSAAEIDNKKEESDESALAIQVLVDYVNSIFPKVSSSKPLYRVLMSEMYNNHEYVRFFFKLSDHHQPVLLIFKMICLQSYLLFLLALLYDLNYPDDDGSCEHNINQSSCLERKSLLDSSQTYCQWTFYDGTTVGNYDGITICSYNQPKFSFNTALYISTMITVATILYMFPLEYALDVLAAPSLPREQQSASVSPINANAAPENSALATAVYTRHVESTNDLPVKTHGPAVVHDSLCWSKSTEMSIRRLPYAFNPSSSISLALQTHFSLMNAQQALLRTSLGLTSLLTLEALEMELKAQVILLQNHPQLTAEFCRAWGVESTGARFMQELVAVPRQGWLSNCRGKKRVQVHVRELVEQELEEVGKREKKAWDEIQLFRTESEKGYELLRLFVIDLLGRDSSAAIVFRTKTDMECPVLSSSPVPKLFVLLLLLSLDAFFIYYAILKGFSKGLSWQFDYVKAWGLQVVLDVVVFETVKCLWLHVFLPRSVGKEVRQAREKVLAATADLARGCRLVREGCDCEQHKIVLPLDISMLNGPAYFFISHRLSIKLPSLVESLIVRTYYSPLPGPSELKWRNSLKFSHRDQGRKNNKGRGRGRSHVFSPVLHFVVSLPLNVQNMLLRFSEPLLLYALTLAMFVLAQHPIYAIVGGVVVLGGIVALLWDSLHQPVPSLAPAKLEARRAALVVKEDNVEADLAALPNLSPPTSPPPP